MLISMTGFGAASADHDGVSYTVEARSLNAKYLKASVRLPDSLQSLEPEIEATTRRRLHRGTVTITVSCTAVDTAASYRVDRDAAERYLAEVRHLTTNGDTTTTVDLATLLSLPGVLVPIADATERVDAARPVVLELVASALDGLETMRAREGETIAADLLEHHGVIASRLELVTERAPVVVTDFEARMEARLTAMLKRAEVQAEPADMLREIAVYAEKTDIAEEINRLGEHLAHFHQLVTDRADGRPIGRTLDFIAQEMLREANTMTSKSPDPQVSRWAVEIKGAIDRIKEQVQNAE